MALSVINSNGEKELFSFQKVYRSARAVGAGKKLAQKIAQDIKREVYPGIRTSEIYSQVKRLLQREVPRAALRFNLKNSIRKLGPTGFPFEKFIGEVFRKHGFEIRINQHLPGHCLKSYEIDFLAQKGNLIYVGECKYRNFPGEKIHTKDALANYARFADILNGAYFKTKRYRNFKIKTIMVTNAKFTSKSIDYSRCMGVELLGWKYPRNKGLEHLIEKQKLYPITILPSLNSYLKDIFVAKRMMLVQDVLKIDPQRFAKKFSLPVKRFHLLIKEAKILLE